MSEILKYFNYINILMFMPSYIPWQFWHARLIEKLSENTPLTIYRHSSIIFNGKMFWMKQEEAYSEIKKIKASILQGARSSSLLIIHAWYPSPTMFYNNICRWHDNLDNWPK